MQPYGGLSKPQMLALWLADLSKIKLNSREQWSSSEGRKGHANVILTSQTPHLLMLPPPPPFGKEGILELLFIFVFTLPLLSTCQLGPLKVTLAATTFPGQKKLGELLF